MISDKILFEEPIVNLVSYTQGYHSIRFPYTGTKVVHMGPDEVAAYAAKGDFKEESMIDLWKKDVLTKKPEKIGKSVRRIIEESLGRGHGSVGDQAHFNFSIKNLTRAATLQLTGPEYLEHEQQSFRRVSAARGYYVPESMRKKEVLKKVKDVLNESVLLYEKMSEEGIPREDARFELPLLMKTNITTCGNVRELQHLHGMNKQGEVPSYVRSVVNKMIEKAKEVAPSSFRRMETNYEMLAWRPSTQLFATTNETIENFLEKGFKDTTLISYNSIGLDKKMIDKAIKEKNETAYSTLKHSHFIFLVPNSISMNHQLRRQRTLHLSDESLFDAAKRKEIVTPPSIKNSKFSERYEDINTKMLELYETLIDEGIPRSEAIGVIPHSVKLYTLIDVDGFNAIHFIGKRRCTKAQWEIRNVADEISKMIEEVEPGLGFWTQPQCITYRRCPEREPCGYQNKIEEFWD